MSVPSLSLTEFVQSLSEADAQWQKRRKELDDLVKDRAVVVYGFGGKGRFLAEFLAKHQHIDVMVYDGSPDRRQVARAAGFSTLENVEAVVAGSRPVILAACQAQQEQHTLFRSNHLFFQEAAAYFEVPHLAHSAADFQSAVLQQVETTYRVYANLHAASRSKFLAVLQFRASSDPRFLQGARSSVADMWLDVPRQFRRRSYATVLDVGAFDGDTLALFSSNLGCERGLAVEANPALHDSIRSVENVYARGIKTLEVAAWSRTTRLNFMEVRQGMVQVIEDAEGPLAAARLDAFVDESVDYIKMDIEGAELPALQGCQNIVGTFGPDMAVAAYHRPDDLVEIPQCFAALGYRGTEFDLHFAHYSDCVDDSIFYLIRR